MIFLFQICFYPAYHFFCFFPANLFLIKILISCINSLKWICLFIEMNSYRNKVIILTQFFYRRGTLVTCDVIFFQ